MGTKEDHAQDALSRCRKKESRQEEMTTKPGMMKESPNLWRGRRKLDGMDDGKGEEGRCRRKEKIRRKETEGEYLCLS